jgi:hypothetical protein
MRLPLVKGWKNKIVRTVRRAARASPLASRESSRQSRGHGRPVGLERATRERRVTGGGSAVARGWSMDEVSCYLVWQFTHWSVLATLILRACHALSSHVVSAEHHTGSLYAEHLPLPHTRRSHHPCFSSVPPRAHILHIPWQVHTRGHSLCPQCSHAASSYAASSCRILMPRRPRHRRAI